ncbi:MAG: DUF2169 family type VI secretion system accessory protein [Bradymonadia bacterium]
MSKPPVDARPITHLKHGAPLVLFVPDSDLEALKAFHFIVKRTYRWAPDDQAQPSAWQRAFVMGDRHFEDGGPYDASLAEETELGPPKPGTDVFVHGNVYAPGGEATYCRPAIRIGNERRELIATGDRFATIRPGGRVEMTPASKFTVLPLRYELAYGGVDRMHPFGPIPCPSNPLGAGFVVSPMDGEAPRNRWTPLPNLEDPARMLTVDDFFVPGDAIQKARPAAGFGPVPRHWEPRASLAGMPASAKPFWNLLHGAETEMGQGFREMQPSFWQAAAQGYAFPRLEGHEKIELKHLWSKAEEVSFRLPVTRPKLRAGFNDGALSDVRLSLATVSIDVELHEVVLQWRGTLPTPDTLRTLEALKRLPLELDGELTLPAPLLGTGFPIDLLAGEQMGMDLLDLKGLPLPGGPR